MADNYVDSKGKDTNMQLGCNSFLILNEQKKFYFDEILYTAYQDKT